MQVLGREDDPDDPEAARQRARARRVILDAPAIFVPLTVVLELERVMRGFYVGSMSWIVRSAAAACA